MNLNPSLNPRRYENNPVNPLKEDLPINQFFSFVSVSFVLPDGDGSLPYPYPYFAGVTTKHQPPYWSCSPMRYLVREDGSVWCRHSQAGEGRFYPTQKTATDLKTQWLEETQAYLKGSGYTIEDVTDHPLPPRW